MNRDIAKHIARVAFESSAKLGDLIPLMKDHCQEDEHRKLTKAIAAALASISINIMEEIFSDYPDLRQEFEDNINTYRRIL